ncbi:MAG: NAD(P)H-hydrate dehydratase [Actinobacteria bacterium]|nr:MAG: NAD(P)H-hydrate dehydratase [Actinomycetota bacterium]
MGEFEPLYTAEEMKAAEEGHDVEAMMERAGAAVAAVVARDHPGARVVAVCGKGANGGDGRIAAAKLAAEVAEVGAELPAGDVVIDAIFGTGFHGEPREEAARSIEAIRSAGVPVVAVDVPSGVNASTGEVSAVCVEATTTVTFQGEKVGLAVAPGSLHAGKVEVADIGLEHADTAHALVTSEIARRVPQRQRGGNKYRSGSVLVVGGAPGLTGAVCLAAEAAFRADAGYVSVCAPRESLPVVEVRLLEAVKRPLEEAFDAAGRAEALALGPGLGRGEEAKPLVRRLLEETDLPAVVDADALFGFEPVERGAATVLTPHSGELARLLDVETQWVDAHRLEAAHRAVERFRCVVLLKGSETIIAAHGARTLISAGTPRLATAGTGDVLTGIIGAFLAKGIEGQLAAAVAARVHADAALAAPHGRGLVASDVVAELPRVLDAAV